MATAASNESGHHQLKNATDLLRQSLHGSSKLIDEDQIGSGASTPPNGTATPRPDLHDDKRLPSLAQVNNYFAQVRDALPVRSKPTHPSISESASNKHQKEQGQAEEQPRQHMASVDLPQNAPSLPAGNTRGHFESSLPPCQEGRRIAHLSQHPYPTPPLSKRPSLSNDMSNGIDVSKADLADPAPRKGSLQHKRKASDATPAIPLLRRYTLSSPVSSGISKPNVSAHIARPSASGDYSAPSHSPSARPPSSLDSQNQGNQELTNGVERHQNTPPLTPRSGSQEDRRGDSGLRPLGKPARSSSTESDPTIGALKGQLEIVIEEARGIRPSVAPYVVCIFQLNEEITDGPKEDENDSSAVQDGSPADENSLAKGVAMRRIGSGSGTPLTIPGMRSRQSSQTNIADLRRGSKIGTQETTNPNWNHKTTFDVVGENNEIDVSIYDRQKGESFLGHVRLQLDLNDYEHQHEDWYKLQPRDNETEKITGDVRLKIAFHQSGKKQFGPEDFEILKLIGKGTFGQVFQVRKRDTKRIYAMKVLSKKVIVQKKEIQHTIGERNILVRTATTESPFIVGLKFSFQTAADLYLVTDYMSGGELFWHLQKEGRFLEERAKFYIAELILALRHLHQHDIVYRDLKPENILLDANGHIALCDFGLSKANLAKNDTTNTFCGTTEYLAPEVLLDEQGYTKMVDFWSLGVLVFEMCCGWSPFYAEDTQQMYKNIAFGKVRFPRDALSTEGRNFVKGLLNRNPNHRLGAKGDAEELMGHPFFADIDWAALSKKLTNPPFKPKLKGELDVSNFDPEFTNALQGDSPSALNAHAAALASGVNTDSTPLSPTMQNQFKGFTFVDESTLEQQYRDRDANFPDGPTSPIGTHFGSGNPGNRMSGVEPTSADSEFNHGMLEDI